MSTSKTNNLGLHAWERTDAFKMDEFNDNFSKIDKAVGEHTAALAAKAEQSALNALTGKVEEKADQTTLAAVSQVANGAARLHVSSYEGKGTVGVNYKNSITFPFTPKLVILSMSADDSTYFPSAGSSGSSSFTNATMILFWGVHNYFFYGNHYINNVTYNDSTHTMTWYCTLDTSPIFQFNELGKTYHYIAIG